MAHGGLASPFELPEQHTARGPDGLISRERHIPEPDAGLVDPGHSLRAEHHAAAEVRSYRTDLTQPTPPAH